MVKDRIQEFQTNAEKYEDNEDITISNHFAIIDMEAPVLSDIFCKVNFLGNTIDKITELVDVIEHLQSAMLVAQPDPRTKNKLEGKMMEIRQLSDNVRKHLKEMKHIQEIEIINDKKNIRQRIIKVHIDVITKRFCDIINKYHSSVITYRERCRTRITRQSQIAGIERNDNEIDDLLENGHSIFYPQIIIDIQQTKQILNNMEERHFSIIKIENSIRELHDMFIDVDNLIESQGIQISSIEEYVSKVDEYMEESRNIILVTENSNRFVRKLFRKKFISSVLRLFASCI